MAEGPGGVRGLYLDREVDPGDVLLTIPSAVVINTGGSDDHIGVRGERSSWWGRAVARSGSRQPVQKAQHVTCGQGDRETGRQEIRCSGFPNRC